MTMTINISPKMQARLEAEAAKSGQESTAHLQVAAEDMLMSDAGAAEIDAGWDSLTALIDRCQMDTGVTDLAHQHDHYIHGTPKQIHTWHA